MAKKFEIYKCSKCGGIVSVNHSGNVPVCCGEVMNLLLANSVEASTEKHIPVLTEIEKNKYKIIVGEIEHPMAEEHYIEWIEVLFKNNSRLTFFLNPKEKPEVIFTSEEEIEGIFAYCNLHGLWKK